MDVILGATAPIDFPDEIEKTRVHLCRLVLAPVTQEIVDLLKTLGIEAAVTLERNFGLFAGMDEVELEAAVFRSRLGHLHGPDGSSNDSKCRTLSSTPGQRLKGL
ncbi:hypothetical protein D3C80_513720 [compost metagenome]